MRTSAKLCLLLLIGGAIITPGHAQTIENAGQYMGEIGKANDKVTITYLSYLSAVGHNKGARKVEKRRAEVLTTISDARFAVQGMLGWKGDKTYRDTTVAYLKLLYNVFNEDYAKIVNMEEIAEQSYDAMEAYMLAQEKASEKLAEAAIKQQRTQKTFADKYDIKLLANTTDLEEKSKQAGQLMNHYGDVYLVFFKAYKQEAYLMAALEKSNVIAIEQNKNALEKFAVEGLEKLSHMHGYNNNPSIIVACREAMNFYKDEAKTVAHATEFALKNEAFAKMKKAFESKPASSRTQKDVDEFNKGVNDINNAVNTYNNTNNQINKERQRVLN
ncbi:MAG: hypothetical protein V4676_07660, partial [Bacteroidota bacterium]